MQSKTGWIESGVEGIRTGGVSQSNADLISNTAVGEG